MNKLHILCISAFLCLCFNLTFAQGIVNVNPLTGSASVAIPIYNAINGGVSIPIELVYSGSGIKPKDIESSAGMGWTLSAGGQISRVVKGLPDDAKADISGNPRLGWMYNSNQHTIDTLHILNDGVTCSKQATDIHNITTDFGNLSDTEPDGFYVSAPGLSCQLVFDQSINNFKTIPYQDLKISYTTSGSTGSITSFTIVNSKGTKYVFGAADLAAFYSTFPASNIEYFKNAYRQYQYDIEYTDSWSLTSIADISGNIIRLTYKGTPGTQKRVGSNPVNLYIAGNSTASLQYSITNLLYRNKINQIIIGDDTTSSHRITFTWQMNGVAFSGTNSALISTIQGRGINLKLGYSSVVYYDDTLPISDGYYRYFLRKVIDSTCNTPINYNFSYIGETPYTGGYSTVLPDSTSKQYDYWGYYNATPSSVPAVYVDPSDTTYQRYAVHAGSNHNAAYKYTVGTSNMMVDTVNVSAGSLNKITYATGGATTIKYQSNDYLDIPSGVVDYGGGIRVRQVIDYDGLDSTRNIVRNYSYLDPSTGKSSGKPISLPVYAFTIPYSGTDTVGVNRWKNGTAISDVDLSTEDHTILYQYVTMSQTNAGHTTYQYYIPATNWDKTGAPVSNPTVIDWRPTTNFVARTSCSGTYGPLKNDSYTYPFVSNANYDFERGLPQKVASYNEAGAEVSESDYSYIRSYANVTAIPGLQYDYNGGTSGVLAYSKYDTYANTSELTSQVVTKIFDTLAVNQSSTTNYVYGSPNHKLLTQQSVTNSDNTALITNLQYTKDIPATADTNANLNAIYKLKQENMNVPVETWSQVKRVDTTFTTSASLTYFKPFIIGTDTLYLPSQQYGFVSPNGYRNFAKLSVGAHTLIRDTSYRLVSNYTAYDSTGTLMTMDDAHHHIGSVITDHYSNKPAISVSNAAWNEIAFSDFDSKFYKPYIPFTLSGAVTYVAGHTGQAVAFTTTQTLTSPTITKNTLTKSFVFSAWINTSATGTHHLTVALSSGTNYTVNYTSTSGSWKYFEWSIPASSIITSTFNANIITNANIDIDDVILYPENSEVNTYSYDPITKQQLAVTNTNGISAYYDYDVMGRLVHAYDQFKNIISRNKYVTASSLAGCTGQLPNYVQQETIKLPGVITDAQVDTLTLPYKQTSRVYSDGLGRGLQAVAFQASPNKHDIIQPSLYDNLGRQVKGFLPYAGKATDTTGSYRANAITVAQPAFYNSGSNMIAQDDSAFNSETIEKSPLQRVLASGMVGEGFQPGGTGTNHYKTVSYRSNSSAKDGNIMIADAYGNFTGNYADHMLSVMDATDEDGTEALVFKDIAGRTMLKRQVTGNGSEPYLDTYYLYNTSGAISFIVPPKATHLIVTNVGYTLKTTAVANLIFKYVYDNLGRLVEKTSPGSILSYIIFDPLNRPVLSQDPKLRAANQWAYIKYDGKGRPISSGIYTDNTSGRKTRVGMQAYVNSIAGYATAWYETRSIISTRYYYTIAIFPNTNITPLAYNYYDNYDLNFTSKPNYAYKSQGLPHEATQTTQPIKGIPTMSVIKNIGPGFTTDKWLLSATFYDQYGHAIQTRTNNQLNYTQDTLTDTKTNVLDFTGRPLIASVVKVTGSGTGNTNTVKTTFNYDSGYTHLASLDQQYNSQASVRIAAYSYNEINQLILKQLGQTATGYLQSVNYRYNIRGQLTNINNSKLKSDAGVTSSDSTDVFGMQVMYNNPDSHINNVVASYSGRPSAIKWMSRDGSGNRTNERSYAFIYDKMGRYSREIYAERTVGGVAQFNKNMNGNNEGNLSYDENGNILTLQRNSANVAATSFTKVDGLAYTYDGTYPNRLSNMVDSTGNNLGFNNAMGSTGNYTYDNTTGNLTNDPYKGLSLKYNSINRIDSIMTALSSLHKGYITYTYDGAGNVLRKQVYSDSVHLQSTTDYVGGFVYADSTLSYFPMPEGRVVNSGGTLIPEYVISDQQGNARFSFDDDGTGKVRIRQENSYYAFGESLVNSTVGTPPTPNINLFNGGAERQNEFSNLPDYDQTFYRNYDPALGRFIGIDPMPESAESMTNYNYSGNNPVMFNDPLGDAKLPTPPPAWTTHQSSTYTLETYQAYGVIGLDGNFESVNYGGGFSGGYVNINGGQVDINNVSEMGMPVSTKSSDAGAVYADADVTGGDDDQDMADYLTIVIHKNDGTTEVINDGSNRVYDQDNDGYLHDTGTSDPWTYSQLTGDFGESIVAPVNSLNSFYAENPVALAEVKVSATQTHASQGGSSILSNFYQGFTASGIHPSNLDLSSPSFNTSLWSAGASIITKILKSRSGDVADLAGRSVGGVAVVVGVISDYQRPQGLTYGSAAKFLIGSAEVAFPAFGLIYGGADVLTGLFTGETLTDRIGDGVDSALK